MSSFYQKRHLGHGYEGSELTILMLEMQVSDIPPLKMFENIKLKTIFDEDDTLRNVTQQTLSDGLKVLINECHMNTTTDR